MARIEAAYRERDATAAGDVYRFDNPGYAFYMQSLEWSVLDALRRSRGRLDGVSVLDIGCGTGYMLHRFSEFGASALTGVDLMPERIEAARARYPGLHFLCGNAADLPFADGQFDVVTQFTCFSSVLDPALRASIAAEMWRVVRPGGRVLTYDMRPAPRPIRMMRSLGGWRRGRHSQATGPVTPTVEISADELNRLFPNGRLNYRSVGLAFGLCAIASRSYLGARLLSGLPFLREHAIGVAVKP